MAMSRSEDRSRSPQRAKETPRYPLARATDISTSISTSTTSENKRVAILGGSFDPITNAHILQAVEILHTKAADELWLVPCGRRPDKPSLKTPYLHRLLMCHLAIDSEYGSKFPLRVCDVEMPFERALQTLDCFEELEKQYPDKEFHFVLGSDLLPDIFFWCKEPDRQKRLLSKRFIVINRPGYEVKKRITAAAIPDWAGTKKLPEGFEEGKLPSNFSVMGENSISIEISAQNLSSSEIRKRYKQDGAWMVEGLVPGSVLNHIIRYELYSD